MNVITRYVKNNSSNQKSSNPSNSFENPKTNVVNKGYENRFLNNDIGFFDFFYNNKFNNTKAKIKHIRKKTYFYNVFIFINRIKNIIKIKSVKLMRNNLQIYLRDEVLK